MERPKLIWTANFIRGIADLPRERCARGEHRDDSADVGLTPYWHSTRTAEAGRPA